MFSSSATTSENQMNSGLAGRSRYSRRDMPRLSASIGSVGRSANVSRTH
jgi:hypothetical protein